MNETQLALAIVITVMYTTVLPMTVLIHELGHGIPALIFTKEEVHLLIGSYDLDEKHLQLKFGRLLVSIRKTLFPPVKGVMLGNLTNLSLWQLLIVYVSGAVFTFIAAIIIIFCSFYYDLHGSLKLFAVLFTLISIAQLFSNLIPNNQHVCAQGSQSVYNDGKAIQLLIKYQEEVKSYHRAWTYSEQGLFEKAIAEMKKYVPANPTWEVPYQCIASWSYQLKNYEQVLEYLNLLSVTRKLTAEELSTRGLVKSRLGFHDDAIGDYDQALAINPNEYYTLSNKAFTELSQEKYEEALANFSQVLTSHPQDAYAYSNRGLLRIKLDSSEEGLKDIFFAKQLDPEQAYAYRSLGIYYLEKGEYEKAKDEFDLAFSLDKETVNINHYLQLVNAHLAGGNEIPPLKSTKS